VFSHRRNSRGDEFIGGVMPIKKYGLIIETPTEARQAESGPSVLAVLTISTCLAVLILAGVWFAFFRT
jgi:hypothetical protein